MTMTSLMLRAGRKGLAYYIPGKICFSPLSSCSSFCPGGDMSASSLFSFEEVFSLLIGCHPIVSAGSPGVDDTQPSLVIQT
jgi:hypothetical protein